jgi:hypothetical protein
MIIALLASLPARGESKGPKAGKEMSAAVEAVNKQLGLESYPPPHCLKWGFGHKITVEEVRACVDTALKSAALPELGQSYVVVVLMSEIGPQTVIALALDVPGWAALSCDPGKPCPPRHAGADKMGKRVVDRTDRACKLATTLWFPERKGCP